MSPAQPSCPGERWTQAGLINTPCYRARLYTKALESEDLGQGTEPNSLGNEDWDPWFRLATATCENTFQVFKYSLGMVSAGSTFLQSRVTHSLPLGVRVHGGWSKAVDSRRLPGGGPLVV